MGTYHLRPLTTGEILDGALTLLRRYFGLLLGIALVCEGLPTALNAYLGLAGGGAQHPGLTLLDRILTALGSMLVTGATVRVVSEAYLGKTPGSATRCASPATSSAPSLGQTSGAACGRSSGSSPSSSLGSS